MAIVPLGPALTLASIPAHPRITLPRAPDGTVYAAGTTTLLTLAAHEGFQGDVELSVAGAPPGVEYRFFNPNGDGVRYPHRSDPRTGRLRVQVPVSGKTTVTLTLFANSRAARSSSVPVKVTSLSASGPPPRTLALPVSVVQRPLPAATPPPGTYPFRTENTGKGIFRKVESAGWRGLSATIKLPKTDSQTASIVVDDPTPATNNFQDSAYIYTGGTAGGVALDVGLQLGHTGNRGWRWFFFCNDRRAHYLGPVSGQAPGAGGGPASPPRPVPGEPVLPGLVTMRFRVPGFPGEAIPDSQVRLSIGGRDTAWFVPGWTRQNTVTLKRVNAIAQDRTAPLPDAHSPVRPPKFYTSGSFVLGAEWQQVKLYSAEHPNGLPWTLANVPGTNTPEPTLGSNHLRKTRHGSYPGRDYVTWEAKNPQARDIDNEVVHLRTLLPAPPAP